MDRRRMSQNSNTLDKKRIGMDCAGIAPAYQRGINPWTTLADRPILPTAAVDDVPQFVYK